MISPGSRFAVACPGAGAQLPGMLWRMHRDYPVVRAVLTEAERRTGLPLSAVCLEEDGPMGAVEVVHPAIFVASVAAYRALGAEYATAPVALAGHSLGQYAALVCAGVLDFGPATEVVAERAALMATQQQERPGAMVSVAGWPVARVTTACRHCPAGLGTVVVGCVNGATEIVVSGDAAATEWLTRAMAGQPGTSVRAVPSGLAAHSPLMAPVERRLRPRIESLPLRDPPGPLLLGTAGTIVTGEAQLRKDLAGQLTATVWWATAMRTLASLDVGLVLDLGPGQSLTRLFERDGQLRAVPLNALEPLRRALDRAATHAAEPAHAGQPVANSEEEGPCMFGSR